MAYLILAALFAVGVALVVRPFVIPPADPAERPPRDEGRTSYRDDIRQDFLMGKIAPEEYEAALEEEDGE